MERPVAIFGAGVTGRAVETFLNQRGVETVFYDERPHLSGEAVNDFLAAPTNLHQLGVISPGFSRRHPWLQAARRQRLQCIGDLDLGFVYWPGKVIAITGTNGKSTTTMLLEAALRQAGVDARACGNIGNPMVNLVDSANEETWAVAEVSSFQSEMMQLFQCDAVLWTNFDEDHLDRHAGLLPYFRAKAHLLTRRRDSTSPAWVGRSVVEAARSQQENLPGSCKEIRVDDYFLRKLDEDSSFRHVPQAENFCLVAALWESFQLPEEALLKTANRLQMLPHRLEKVAAINDLNYWNDSKATNFSATLAALQRFEQKVYWIGGGRDKGGDLERFVDNIAPRIGQAFLIGETGPELSRLLRLKSIRADTFPSLEAAVEEAHRLARGPGDILFSPGFSSFDQFKNYADRGETFRSLVERELPSETPSLHN